MIYSHVQQDILKSSTYVCYLVDELAPVDVVRNEDLCPKLGLAPPDEVPGLLLEHRVLIGDRNEFVVAETFRVGNVRKVGITLLAELANYQRLVQLITALDISVSRRMEELTLFSLRKASGLLFESMYIFARALKTAGS